MQKAHIIFISILISRFVIPSTYYVDSSNGNDLSTGKLKSRPWKTIMKVNSTLFERGDTILFKCGEKWREQLTITSNNINIGNYGDGDYPVISGAELINGFTLYSGAIWAKTNITSDPQQVFFNELRGNKKNSVTDLISEREWFFDSSNNTLFVYSSTDPANKYLSPGIERCQRNYGIYISSKSNIYISKLHIEKTINSAVRITSASQSIILDNLDILQWSVQYDNQLGGIQVLGNYCEIKNCTLGKKTGEDLNDQKWAGFIGIYVEGISNNIHNNFIFHTSAEQEDINGNYAYGIRVNNAKKTTTIMRNYIYHTGSAGIYISSSSVSGDSFKVAYNTVEYAGLAGISAYKTRGRDGIGGKGFIYNNDISYCNRSAGTISVGTNSGCGIHINDGIQSGVDPTQPFIEWFIYENNVHDCQAPASPQDQDSGGIGVDFNANNAKIYRNRIYNNWGKGIYIYNADEVIIAYNIIYGNDAGITIGVLNNGTETANNNIIYNNTLYKNYNGNHGPGYNCEIYIGGISNVVKNNIMYASNYGYAYIYGSTYSSGCLVDYNILFQESGTLCSDWTYGKQTFTAWKLNHPGWDVNSKNKDPKIDSSFSPYYGSPTIDAGINVGFNNDYYNHPIQNIPDIGAIEFISIKLDVKIFLQGPYCNNKMNSSLGDYSIIPLHQPYKSSPWEYMGLENVSVIPAGIVDWALVELRDNNLPSSAIKAQRAGFIKSDGHIVDLDGKSSLGFADLSQGSYYIVVKHRNHLSIMSSNPIMIMDSVNYDFTSDINKAYGQNAMIDLGDGKFGMIAGDSDGNGMVNVGDYTITGNNIFMNGYMNGDLDMNGSDNILDYVITFKSIFTASRVP